MKVKPVKIEPFHAYRTCHTGVTFYSCCEGDREIGRITVPTMPVSTVYLNTDLTELLCDVDWGLTVFPGASREIYYGDREVRDELHARIIYRDQGHHSLLQDGQQYEIFHKEGIYSVLHNGEVFGRMTFYPRSRPASNEPCLTLKTTRRITPETAVILLAFPCLQIGW